MTAAEGWLWAALLLLVLSGWAARRRPESRAAGWGLVAAGAAALAGAWLTSWRLRPGFGHAALAVALLMEWLPVYMYWFTGRATSPGAPFNVFVYVAAFRYAAPSWATATGLARKTAEDVGFGAAVLLGLACWLAAMFLVGCVTERLAPPRPPAPAGEAACPPPSPEGTAP